jgi:alpha-tubulin suppressor-like RCC1 family protein
VIREICCGSFHSILIDIDGYVFTFGDNGFGDNCNKVIPERIRNIPSIRTTSAGYCHSILIDTNGNVYSYGYNYHYQLGFCDRINRSTLTQHRSNWLIVGQIIQFYVTLIIIYGYLAQMII